MHRKPSTHFAAVLLMACTRPTAISVEVSKPDAMPVAPPAIPSGAECASAADCIQQGTCFGIPACSPVKTAATPICDPKHPPPKMPSFRCACDAGRCTVDQP